MSEQKHTPEPWVYRPGQYDDWGFIRSTDGTLVARSLNSSISYEEENVFRSEKKDPYEPNGKRIVLCVNAFAGIENPAAFMEAVEKLEQAADVVKNQFAHQSGHPVYTMLMSAINSLEAAKGTGK